jgi:hypothetical protein
MEASPRKSTLSAKSETEPIARATANSTAEISEVQRGNQNDGAAEAHVESGSSAATTESACPRYPTGKRVIPRTALPRSR